MSQTKQKTITQVLIVPLQLTLDILESRYCPKKIVWIMQTLKIFW